MYWGQCIKRKFCFAIMEECYGHRPRNAQHICFADDLGDCRRPSQCDRPGGAHVGKRGIGRRCGEVAYGRVGLKRGAGSFGGPDARLAEVRVVLSLEHGGDGGTREHLFLVPRVTG